MGSSRFIFEEKSKVESTSLTILFERMCPIYMSYGMSFNEFWYGDAGIVVMYRETNKLKLKRQDENNWMIGMYVYEAILDCSPILHPFSKRGTKPLPYAEKPYLMDKLDEQIKTEEQRKAEEEQMKENERLKFMVQMNNWFRATSKQFKNKER